MHCKFTLFIFQLLFLCKFYLLSAKFIFNLFIVVSVVSMYTFVTFWCYLFSSTNKIILLIYINYFLYHHHHGECNSVICIILCAFVSCVILVLNEWHVAVWLIWSWLMCFCLLFLLHSKFLVPFLTHLSTQVNLQYVQI